MNTQLLVDTARAMAADDKRLLAMDESHPACNKRFAKLGIPQTEERCRNVAEEALRNVFIQLNCQRVVLEAIILKPTLVLPGLTCPQQASAEQVAKATVQCLLRKVPAPVPGIAFLWGGQSAELASAQLNAMNEQTCAPAALGPIPRIESDLAEWDNGDDEGRTSAEILKSRPDWNLFRDGSPNGETPAQISDRADRFIAQVRALAGNAALFSHSHFGRVLAARWIGLPVAQAQHLLLNTASVSVLCYEHERTDQPAIALWNSVAPESLAPATDAGVGERSAV